MDLFKKTTKILRDKFDENSLNTRREAENYPMIEAKVDEIVFDKPYKMEFNLSDHPHSVKLNMYIRPPVNCFKCQTGDMITHYEAIAGGGVFGPGDGEEHLTTYTFFTKNDGGFELGTTSSIIVPRSGVYIFRFVTGTTGVTTSVGAAVIASIYANEALILRKSWSVVRGTLAGGGVPAFFGLDINLIAPCIPMAQGDSFSVTMAATGIAFYNPIPGSITATLIALA